MSNLPPGISDNDIEINANGDTCICGHSEAEHIDTICDIPNCDCKEYESF